VPEKMPPAQQQAPLPGGGFGEPMPGPPPGPRETECDQCVACLGRAFCSFRTPLFPVLAIVAFLNLYTFVARLALGCQWHVGWTETFSIFQCLMAGLFAYGILKEKGWLCSGWLFACVWCLYSAILSICEGVIKDCKVCSPCVRCHVHGPRQQQKGRHRHHQILRVIIPVDVAMPAALLCKTWFWFCSRLP